MRKPFVTALAIIPFLISCQKEMSISPENQRPADAGSGQLIKSVEIWDNHDSLVTKYEYDNDERLIKATSLSGWGTIVYHRDLSGRIIQMEKIAASNGNTNSDVFYEANTERVSFILSRMANTVSDSTAFHYTNSEVTRTELFAWKGTQFKLSSYSEWDYNAAGNLSNLKVFVTDSNGNIVPNISYDFEYDTKINPFYSADDARILENWYMVASPNNLVRQTNHYESSGSAGEDYVELSYEYGSDNKPFKVARSGPAIGTSQVASSFFYE